MRPRLPLILLALASSANAADTISVGHRVVPDKEPAAAKPMAWRYGMLQTARELFDERAPGQAPGATLSFRLPKVDDGDNHVELVEDGRRSALPMTSATAFTFAPDTAAAADALVVVNRDFPPGVVNHPNVQVRSPGLPDNVQRMGDLRLACAAQIAMVKTEGLKIRAVFGMASLFGLDVCKELDVTKADPPAGKYDTVTIEEGERRLVLQGAQAKPPQLGDTGWSDEARISYTLAGQVMQ